MSADYYRVTSSVIVYAPNKNEAMTQVYRRFPLSDYPSFEIDEVETVDIDIDNDGLQVVTPV